MSEVFDTYAKRTIAYYVINGIMIIPLILFALTNIFNSLQISKLNEQYLGFAVCLGLAVYFIFRNSFVKMYVKDGDISFIHNTINVNSLAIPLGQLNKIVVKANDYKGSQRGTSDGSGNRIKIYDKSGKVYTYRFVIKSYMGQDNLKKILIHYTQNGLIVTTNDF
jgi:hypothetical protein